MNRCILSCDLHDYIEIACIYRYRVRLILKNNTLIEGKACDIASSEKREYLLIDQGQTQRVDLIEIKKMEVLTPNAKFKEVNF